MGVPYTFATATTSIPLSELDANFNTPVTIGTSTVGLGNTITSISNLTLTNVTIVSGTSNITQNLANVTGTLASANGGTGQSNITFPSSGGTAMVSGNMPAFSAYLVTSDQSISSSTFTKVQFNAKLFDTANCFDSTTNYRFTPNVAGYYQFNWTLTLTCLSSGTRAIMTLYKNGSIYCYGSYLVPYNGTTSIGGGSCVVYMNGTTDYVEVYGYITGTGTTVTAGVAQTLFSGSMVRAA